MESNRHDDMMCVVVFKADFESQSFNPIIASSFENAMDALREVADGEHPGQTLEMEDADKFSFKAFDTERQEWTKVVATIYRDVPLYN